MCACMCVCEYASHVLHMHCICKICRQQQQQLPAVRIRHAQRATATVTATATATATAMPTAMPTAATAQFLLSHFRTLALSHAFCFMLHCSFNIAAVAATVAARSRRFIAIMLQLARNALACLREREREKGREACVRVHCLHFKLNSFKFQFLPL